MSECKLWPARYDRSCERWLSRKSYAGGVEAINGVDFDVRDGEFCVLVGPSGCGKSTLLRMVAGLETITGGEIAIGGRVVNELEPTERDIAMVFQNYALYPHMSVYDNMAYGLRNRGMPKAEIDTRVREAARILELAPLLERKPRQLSGGQRQRVAMGRAIVREPEVFLFDEPLSNLDAKLRVQMRVEIQKLQRRARHHVALRHPRPGRGDDAGRQLIVMNAGRVEQIGTPLEVYQQPADHVRRRLHRLAADEPAADERRRAGPPLGDSTICPKARSSASARRTSSLRRRHQARRGCRPAAHRERGRAGRAGKLRLRHPRPRRHVIVRGAGRMYQLPGERAVAVASAGKIACLQCRRAAASVRQNTDPAGECPFLNPNRHPPYWLVPDRVWRSARAAPVEAPDRASQSRLKEDFEFMSRVPSLSSPFLLGFDEIERVLDRVTKAADGYPPYNIERVPRDERDPELLRITLAVAGFTREQLDVSIEENQLVIRGRHRMTRPGSISTAVSRRVSSSGCSCWPTGSR